MTKGVERRRNVHDAIFADEIGIEYGVVGDHRLWTAYQPIFAPRDAVLDPVAVEALMQPRLSGEVVPVDTFLAGLAAEDRLFVETLSRTLHIRNFRNLDAQGLQLFFNYDPCVNDHPGRVLADLANLREQIEECAMDPADLVCEIIEKEAADDDLLAEIVQEMRRLGLRVAIDDFGSDHSTEDRLRLLQPDIVKIDGGWFAELCRHTAAERLFRALLSLLHERGAKVLVEGIEQPLHLRVALDGGADMLQGFLLGRAAPAGAIFDETPLELDRLLYQGSNVISLFG
ncbi:diguanylate phosphodiesterase [Mesorhizobium sp. Root554]|uniref:EAL domain-containing protein n=1 Tax=unclassified Mesorhizobium TaxID=325217 RepID=UPI0006F7A3ED|nr:MULTISPECIES: EAL domain-containing protein [unclassified Mesorhizobium]KQZ14203.1 diguanylate phosphodiesterase [Mesorhizobium sp. Root1471]KQZ36715.1 diguanylate phosphodiesterase [Mesorhizobium sp. Root554]